MAANSEKLQERLTRLGIVKKDEVAAFSTNPEAADLILANLESEVKNQALGEKAESAMNSLKIMLETLLNKTNENDSSRLQTLIETALNRVKNQHNLPLSVRVIPADSAEARHITKPICQTSVGKHTLTFTRKNIYFIWRD